MKPKRNPVCRQGDKNVFCPYYGACLDHAVKHSWAYWVCSDCSHQSVEQPVLDDQSLVDSSVLYYSLPSRIHRKVQEIYS